MFRKIAILLLVLMILAMGAYVVISIQRQEPPSIVGRWVHDQNGAIYTFSADGTVQIELPMLTPYTANYILDKETATLEIQLIVDSQIQRQESTYVLDNNTLTLTNVSTGSTVTMTRQTEEYN